MTFRLAHHNKILMIIERLSSGLILGADIEIPDEIERSIFAVLFLQWEILLLT
jgi:hypothetical protein